MKGKYFCGLILVASAVVASTAFAYPQPRSIFMKCDTTAQANAIKKALESKIKYEIASATPQSGDAANRVNLSGLKVTVIMKKAGTAASLEIPYANMDRLHGNIASGGFNGTAPTLSMNGTEVNGPAVIANDCVVKYKFGVRVTLPVFDDAQVRFVPRTAFIGTEENPRYVMVP